MSAFRRTLTNPTLTARLPPGCWPTCSTITAAKRGADATGVEFNPKMVELSRRAAQKEGVAGKAKFIEVETGITGESDIQILKGLSAGQDVITGPSRILNTLKEGTVVKRQEKKDAGNSNKS